MGGGHPATTTTTTTSHSASNYDLPSTASYSSNNWVGPHHHTESQSQRAWTTQNHLDLQNLAFLGKDGQVHSVNNNANGVHMLGAAAPMNVVLLI